MRGRSQSDSQFIFHLWFPDIANQLMNKNWYVCIDADFIVHNNWQVKLKYDQWDQLRKERKRWKDGTMLLTICGEKMGL